VLERHNGGRQLRLGGWAMVSKTRHLTGSEAGKESISDHYLIGFNHCATAQTAPLPLPSTHGQHKPQTLLWLWTSWPLSVLLSIALSMTSIISVSTVKETCLLLGILFPPI
jgi:hypothetical protein